MLYISVVKMIHRIGNLQLQEGAMWEGEKVFVPGRVDQCPRVEGISKGHDCACHELKMTGYSTSEKVAAYTDHADAG
jgi:hypothetical protein